MARTEAASTGCLLPDPCVPVELEPPTEMCGRDPMLSPDESAAADVKDQHPEVVQELLALREAWLERIGG